MSKLSTGPTRRYNARVLRAPLVAALSLRGGQFGQWCPSRDWCARGDESLRRNLIRDGANCRFMHATSSRDKGRKCIVDRRISQYLAEKRDNMGLIVFRPNDVA